MSHSAGRDRDQTRLLGRVALTPLANAFSVLLTLATLAVATRTSDPGNIAGYMAGSSAVAFLAVLAGGGTTIAYATGSAHVRSCVKFVRYRFIVPIMAIGAVLVSLIYDSTTTLLLAPVLLGGLTVVANNLSELESAGLQRLLQTGVILTGSTFSRTIGLAAVLFGFNFAESMLVASIMNLAILTYGNRRNRDDPLTPEKPRLKASLRVAYRWELVFMTGLDVFATRAAFIALPYLSGLSKEDADAFAALLSACQSLTAVLTTGLYTIMAHRSLTPTRPKPAWVRKFERIVIITAFLAAPLGAASGPIILSVLGLTTGENWLILMLAATPFVCLNRSRQYQYVAQGSQRQAATTIGLVAIFTATWAFAATSIGRIETLAATALFGESLGWMLVTLYLLLRKMLGSSAR